MRHLLVKICGITNVADAMFAVEAGADMIGVILVPGTARFVTDHTAREIVLAVGRKAKTVGVFRDAEAVEVNAKRAAIGLDIVQLHGSESPAVVDACAPCIKAYSEVVSQSGAEFVLFDRPKGSTDELWLDNLVASLVLRAPTSPFLVAGGITADSVPKITERLRHIPSFAGLDVASGVERAPGLKDHAKLSRFISAVKEANHHAITG
jgi:phosphoribosylanthranilate isomerase